MPVQWAAGGSFIVYLVMTYFVAKWLNLSGMEFYIFFGMLSALGITGAGLWIYFKRKKDKEGGGAAAGGGGAAEGDASIDQIIREADLRLSTQNVTIANLPLVFVVGDRGSTKTSTMVYSGVEPELIGGAAFGENAMVIPTAHTNVWFARGTAFVEAAGAVFADPSKWVALVRKLKPAGLKSLVGKGRQAPRGVLLCFDIESFARPGGSEAVAAAARYIQARFAEISQMLGINFPVYVLFTRTDRIQFFTDFVRNFSNEEATQVFGATLPLRPVTSGVYAEEESRRLNDAFNNLFHSLCDKRTVFLPRESDPAKTPQPYEFPREFAKLRASIINFLVEVCRPSQLSASPFLRGFYFSGVRPITVSDAAPIAIQKQSQEDALRGAGAATQMFRLGKLQEEMQKQAQAQTAPGGRRVPQWMFLGHLFNNIVLNDSAALAASGSSTKTSFLQRLLLGLAAGLFLLYSIGLLVSFLGNKGLEDKSIAATKELQIGADLAGCALPSVEQLQKLDSLRQSLEQLTDYKYNGAPIKYRLGLYAGNELLPEVRKAYYDRFRALLFGQTQKGLVTFMQSRPDGDPNPGDDYGFAYDSVKAYLLTAKESGRASDPALAKFLGSTLHQRWLSCKQQDVPKEVSDLARTQFNFYGGDVAHGQPYPPGDNDPSVPKAQQYLSRFGGVKAAYMALLARADREKPAESYNDKFKESAYGVISRTLVRYAFTKPGYDFVMKLLKGSDFGGEPWVLGQYASSKIPKEELEKGIRELYGTDYVETWRKVLRDASFTGYPGGLQEAETKLQKMYDARSPVLCLLGWASSSTNVDLGGVKDAFQPLFNVQPPSSGENCIVDKTAPYRESLMRLQESVVKANQPGIDDLAKADMLRTQQNSAQNATRGVTAGPVDSVAQLDKVITKLMLAPTEIPMPDPGAKANAAGGAFCVGFNGLKSKFPFKQVEPEVSLQELSDIFKPGTGKLWEFYEKTGKQFVACSSAGCSAQASPPIPVNDRFVKAFSNLVRFSKALYGENGSEPAYKYSLRPKSEFYDSYNISVNGDKSTVKAGSSSKTYVWPGPGSPSFSLEIVQKGNTNGEEVQRFSTLWSVFRFFANAEKTDGTNFTFFKRSGRDNQPTMINGKTATYDFSLDTQGAPAVFSKDFLNSLECVGQVTAKR